MLKETICFSTAVAIITIPPLPHFFLHLHQHLIDKHSHLQMHLFLSPSSLSSIFFLLPLVLPKHFFLNILTIENRRNWAFSSSLVFPCHFLFFPCSFIWKICSLLTTATSVRWCRLLSLMCEPRRFLLVFPFSFSACFLRLVYFLFLLATFAMDVDTTTITQGLEQCDHRGKSLYLEFLVMVDGKCHQFSLRPLAGGLNVVLCCLLEALRLSN